MREILFKAKRKDNNEWIKGCLLILESGYYIVPKNTYYNEIDIMANCTVNAIWEEQDFFEVITETISQYTGLKDKNNVKIFENDIVRVNERYKGLGEVDFLYKVDYIDRLAKYVYNPLIVNGKYDNNNNDVELYCYETNDIEVIGNIFDEEVE